MTAVAVMFSFVSFPAPAAAVSAAISVTDFGANGTDTADDTAAFQNAIDAAVSGGAVTIPAGNYILGQIRVTKPLEISGVGATSVLKLRDGANLTLLAIVNTNNVTVRDLAIDGNIAAQTAGYPHGIQFTATTDSVVTRVDIRNCEKSAVSVYDGSDRVSVTYSRFDNNENDVEIHSSAYNYCANNYATNTQYESWVSYEQVGGPGKAHHNTIVNNTSIGAYAGINIERSHDDLVQGNIIENAKWGIMVQGRDSTFSHNATIVDNVLRGGANSTQWGITAENPSHSNTIARNSVTGWLATPLNIQSSNSVYENNTIVNNPKTVPVKASNVIVRNNTFSGSGEVGVQFTGALTDVVFEGNTVSGAAEEGVLVLEAMTRLTFVRNTITGNGASASGTLEGLYSLGIWTDSSFLGNTITNPAGASVQRRPATILDGSTVAVEGNVLSGLVASVLPAATTGASVTIAAPVIESGIWGCTAAGRPGTWALQQAVPAPTPAPTPAPVDDSRNVAQTAVQGADRYATNVAISQAAYPNGADTVVIATGANWPDALGGATLANAVDAPILLTTANQLPPVVLAEIRRLGATKAIILGGTSAVGTSVESVLRRELATVERIAGGNRYQTAGAIAKASVARLGAAYDGTVLLATGGSFADALAASPMAAAKGWPILLVGPKGLAGVQATLNDIGANKVVILGGAGAIGASVHAALVVRYGSSNVARIAGGNRYATSVAIATWAVANAGLDWNRVAMATGANFPDALSGGVLQAQEGSVLLLTTGASLNSDAKSCLALNRAGITAVKYLGGPSALTRGVRTAVMSALQ
ncbi:MAG: cell wall-binding repeat-containing protein [Actinomycetota bacterium]|nr:cell wall-binding repeat-containing protein [Actinomycetota bacterium]